MGMPRLINKVIRFNEEEDRMIDAICAVEGYGFSYLVRDLIKKKFYSDEKYMSKMTKKDV